MSGECDKCGDHALECSCDDEGLTTCSNLPKGLVESILNKSLEKTEMLIKYVDTHILNWSSSEWEEATIARMKSRGWENDRNDEAS